MTERYQVYKCEHCGNIVEVLHGAGAQLHCCGSAMVLQDEKTQDAAVEKHVPFVEKTDDGILVRVGQNASHPMEEDHYIEWIQLMADGKEFRQYLSPGVSRDRG